MTAIAPNWPIAVQLGLIALRTMSAANSNFQPQQHPDAKPQEDTPPFGKLNLGWLFRPREEQPDQCFQSAVCDKQRRD